ncbi:MAG: class I SAM-dependent methyltransferase [Streptosporangiaceae bacterium]
MTEQAGDPQERASSVNEPHQARQVAESFGSDAARYDRARPSYPGALVQRVIAASPGPDVLDVGCGTGIAARQFQAAGCRVLGVDPDARMADLARQSGIEVEVAKIEAWDPAGREFDAVIAGQAWHWVDPVAGAARAGQPLCPQGRLAVFWIVFQPPPDVGEAIAAVYRQVMPGSQASFWTRSILDVYAPGFTRAADGIRAAGTFGDPEQWQFDWDRPYTRDQWLEQVPTFGGYDRIPPATQQDILAGIGAAIDALGGSFTMQYTTVAVTAARTSA